MAAPFWSSMARVLWTMASLLSRVGEGAWGLVFVIQVWLKLKCNVWVQILVDRLLVNCNFLIWASCFSYLNKSWTWNHEWFHVQEGNAGMTHLISISRWIVGLIPLLWTWPTMPSARSWSSLTRNVPLVSSLQTAHWSRLEATTMALEESGRQN